MTGVLNILDENLNATVLDFLGGKEFLESYIDATNFGTGQVLSDDYCNISFSFYGSKKTDSIEIYGYTDNFTFKFHKIRFFKLKHVETIYNIKYDEVIDVFSGVTGIDLYGMLNTNKQQKESKENNKIVQLKLDVYLKEKGIDVIDVHKKTGIPYVTVWEIVYQRHSIIDLRHLQSIMEAIDVKDMNLIMEKE